MPRTDLLFGPTPHTEAADFIRSKPPVSKAVFQGLLPELRGRAFLVTGIESATVLQRMRDRIADLPAGGDWHAIKKDLVSDISPHLVDPSASPEDQEAQLRVSERRADLLLKTHGFQAYQTASHKVMQAQVDVLPYWQYLTMEDDRVRPEHAALDKLILPANDPFWLTHTPPWGYGCRCQKVALSQEERDEQRAKDQHLPADQRLVCEPVVAQRLNQGQLTRDGRSYDVRPPSQRDGPSGYAFHPDDLRIPLAQLQKRYDPETWDTFTAWAGQTPLDASGQGPTVMDWLKGQEIQGEVKADGKLAIATWPALDQLQPVKSLGGSTGALLVQDRKTGALYVQKSGNSPEHLRSEVHADNAYRALGANVPEATLIETPSGPVKLAKFVEGKTLGQLKGKALESAHEELRRGFATDALLGNYDVIGMSADNVLVDKEGKVWRIDNGGSFDFRAQGAKKTTWTPYAKEIWGMRDPKLNPSAAAVFGKLDIFSIAKQIEAHDLSALPADLPQPVRDMLHARQAELAHVARKALDMQADQWKAGYTDDLTRHVMGIREAGLTSALPVKLSSTGSKVILKDADGLDFDHLRSPSAHAQALPSSSHITADAHFADIVKGAKHINFHATGDKIIDPAKLAALRKTQAQLASMLPLPGEIVSPATADNHAAAQGYIEKIDQLLASAAHVQAGGAHSPVFVHQHSPQYHAPKPASVDSITKRAADHMAAQGLSQGLAAKWMEAQGGSSWSDDALVYKAFLQQHLDIPDKDVYWKKAKATAQKKLSDYRQIYGPEKLEQSFIAWHAVVQETLATVDLPYNDRARRVTRLIRTENHAAIQAEGVAKGKDRRMKRGLNESSSPFEVTTVYGHEITVQAVPHSRITGTYLLERRPNTGTGSFAGDSENEFTFVGAGVPFDYVDAVETTSKATDATQWGLNLSHLRP